MRVAPGSSEPIIGTWRCTSVKALIGELGTGEPERTRIIAIDGRSASGKTTLAVRLSAAIPNSAIIHTDDVAWNYSMFDWSEVLAGNIITPARAGRPVRYQPPGWAPSGRSGALELPGKLDCLIIEGVGIGRRALGPSIDVLIWVQSDFQLAHERGLARDIATATDRDAAECQEFWDHWMDAEIPFLEKERPWSRADLLVAGTGGPHGPTGDALAVCFNSRR